MHILDAFISSCLSMQIKHKGLRLSEYSDNTHFKIDTYLFFSSSCKGGKA